MRRVALISLIVLVVLTEACVGGVSVSRSVPSESEGQPLDAAAREYVALAVAVGRLDPPSMDWHLESTLETTSLTLSLEDIETRLEQLRARLDVGAGLARRRRDLGLQIDALHTRVEQLLGQEMTFDDELQRLFGVTTLPPAPSRRSEVLAELDRLLPGSGTLPERLSRFDRRFTVPPERLPDVLEQAIAGCRAETVAHIELPAREAVAVEYVTGEPWSAFSQYLGGYRSVLRINTSFPLTVDRVLALACHEAYPGHHASNSLREQALVEQRGLIELSVQPLFSPMAFTAEALASAALAVAFPPDRRLAFERDVLFPLAALDRSDAARYLRVSALVHELEPGIAGIARQYLEGRTTSADAAAQLEREALMAHTTASLRFLDAYRGYALAYTFGSGLLEEEERLRPSRAEDGQIRSEGSASVRAGGGAPAPLKNADRLRLSGHWKRFLEITLAPVPSLQLPPAARAVS